MGTRDMGSRDEQDGSAQESSYQGYDTPGADRIQETNSPAIHTPTETSEERLTTPKAHIDSIGETPGDANPALAETFGMSEGKVSTADMLKAREAAEEQQLRAQHAHMYETQPPDAQPSDWEQKDGGSPNWPNDKGEVSPLEYMESPRADIPLLSGNPETMDPIATKGRVDWAADRAGTQASANESRSGLPASGMNAEEDNYERREMRRPSEESEIDRIAPDMLNIPGGDQ